MRMCVRFDIRALLSVFILRVIQWKELRSRGFANNIDQRKLPFSLPKPPDAHTPNNIHYTMRDDSKVHQCIPKFLSKSKLMQISLDIIRANVAEIPKCKVVPL